MNSKQIYDLVEKDPCLRKVFKGVYASNTLPKQLQHYPSAFIVNNQPLPLSGEHCLAISYIVRISQNFSTVLGNYCLHTTTI